MNRKHESLVSSIINNAEKKLQEGSDSAIYGAAKKMADQHLKQSANPASTAKRIKHGKMTSKPGLNMKKNDMMEETEQLNELLSQKHVDEIKQAYQALTKKGMDDEQARKELVRRFNPLKRDHIDQVLGESEDDNNEDKQINEAIKKEVDRLALLSGIKKK